jgi:nucleoside-diphosphate-sugar epimerase
MIAVGPRKFLHISTSSVYGLSAIGDETSNIDPISPYGVTKAAAEMLLKGYQTNFNLEFIVLRYFSVYGPGQRPDMAYSKFINSIANGKTIDVYGDGKQVRSNTYISDCIQGTLGALFSKETSGVYNIAGKEQRTVLESISIIESILEKKAQINFMNGVPGDQYKTKGDINKAKSAFGFDPVTTLEEGLSHQVIAFKKNSYF